MEKQRSSRGERLGRARGGVVVTLAAVLVAGPVLPTASAAPDDTATLPRTQTFAPLDRQRIMGRSGSTLVITYGDSEAPALTGVWTSSGNGSWAHFPGTDEGGAELHDGWLVGGGLPSAHKLDGSATWTPDLDGADRFISGPTGGLLVKDGADVRFVAYGSDSPIALGVDDVLDADWLLNRRYALRVTTGAHGELDADTLTARPLDGSARPVTVSLHLEHARVVMSDTLVWYVTTAGRQLKLCSASPATLVFSCQVQTFGKTSEVPSPSNLHLYPLGDSAVATYSLVDYAQPDHLLTPGHAPVTIKWPAGAVFESLHGRTPESTWTSEGGALLTALHVDGRSSVVTVGTDGGVRTLGDLKTIDSSRTDTGTVAALTPTRILTLDDRPSADVGGQAIWSRPLVGGRVGPEHPLTGRARTIRASGSRVLVQSTTSKVAWYDGDRSTRTVKGVLGSDLSGPFAVVAADAKATKARLQRNDGQTYGTIAREARGGPSLFGSRTVVRTARTYRVQDLVTGKTVYQGSTDDKYPFIVTWGDWVAVAGVQEDAEGEDAADPLEVIDVKTGRTFRTTVAGLGAVRLGDGFLAGDSAAGVFVWDFSGGGEPRALGAGQLESVEGNRVAWTTWPERGDVTDVKVTTLAFGGLSAPRMLGAVQLERYKRSGKARWTLDVDATKPLAQGYLAVLDGKAKEVRRLPVAAALDGSVRGIIWDGRDDQGKKVKKGTFRWVLHAAGADGSGDLRDLDGTGEPSGRVKVS